MSCTAAKAQHGYDAALITRSATIQLGAHHFCFKRVVHMFNRVELHASFNVARKY